MKGTNDMNYRICKGRPRTDSPFHSFATQSSARKWACNHFGFWEIWNWNGNDWRLVEEVANI